jgi:hypothetical protein
LYHRPGVVACHATQRLLQKQWNLIKIFDLAVIFGPLTGRQQNVAILFQSKQKISGCILFEIAVGLSPLPCFAESFGNIRPALAVIPLNQLVYEQDVIL